METLEQRIIKLEFLVEELQAKLIQLQTHKEPLNNLCKCACHRGSFICNCDCAHRAPG
jgi:hypothetical protein